MKKTREEILRDIATINLVEIQHAALEWIAPLVESQPITATTENAQIQKARKAYKDWQSRSYIK